MRSISRRKNSKRKRKPTIHPDGTELVQNETEFKTSIEMISLEESKPASHPKKKDVRILCKNAFNNFLHIAAASLKESE